jgi:hypothetical protein
MKETKNPYKILVQNPEGKDHLGNFGVAGRIILNSILKKWNVSIRTGLSCFRIGFSRCFGSIKGWSSPDQMNDRQLLKRRCALTLLLIHVTKLTESSVLV